MKTFSKVQWRLLAFFIEHPTKEFYEKEAAQKAGVSVGAANSSLPYLAREGYILQKISGRMKFYRLANTSKAKRMKVQYNLSGKLADELRKLAGDLGARTYVYGSVARGEETEISDWDIILIGAFDRDEAERKIVMLRKKYGKNLKAMIMSNKEWAALEKQDPAFYQSVERDKIELI